MKERFKAPCKRTQHCWPTTPNIVRCYMLRPFAHPVACCWMLLSVVAQSLKPVKLFSQQLPTLPTISWGHARSLRMVYKDLWVVSFPRCTAGPNIAGSCCIRLHTTANTHATTSNIVGATMLGVVAFARSLTSEKSSIPTGLFLYTNMAAVTSCENRKSGN